MKKLLFLLLSLCIFCNSNAQLNSLTIDCQNPGWLDKLIDGPTQVSVQSIKVTGRINSNDLQFLQTLPNLVKVDIEDVDISMDGMGYGYQDNVFPDKHLTNWANRLNSLILPISITKITTSNSNISKISADTLVVGGSSFHNIDIPGSLWLSGMNCLIVRENVDTFACAIKTVKKIMLPSTLKRLNCSFNSSDSVDINIPDSIEEIVRRSSSYSSLPRNFFNKDTIIYPNNLKDIYFGKIDKNIKCKHAYFSSKINEIHSVYYLNSNTSASGGCHAEVLHIDKTSPPGYTGVNATELKDLIIYVPKGSIPSYKKNAYYQYATLLEEPVRVKSIETNSHFEKIKKGCTRTLYATITPSDADNPKYYWHSEDENIATISETGKVTAINSGKTKIYAISEDNPAIKDYCDIEVYQPLSSIEVTTKTTTINVGETTSLSVIPNPIDADNASVTWISSNNNVASVDENGIVLGNKAGKATIIAIAQEDSNIQNSCEITVLQPVTGITINPAQTDIVVGEMKKLSAILEPDDASNKKVSWSSSDTGTCFVAQDGTIVGVRVGTAFIFATSDDGGFVANCMVTVNDEGGVDGVTSDKTAKEIIGIYDSKGIRHNVPQQGVNIIRFNDGTTTKLIIE